mgnify:CR=1 FL=1
MAAARVPVFLLDEHQVVRPGELGTSEDIEKMARRHEERVDGRMHQRSEDRFPVNFHE